MSPARKRKGVSKVGNAILIEGSGGGDIIEHANISDVGTGISIEGGDVQLNDVSIERYRHVGIDVGDDSSITGRNVTIDGSQVPFTDSATTKAAEPAVRRARKRGFLSITRVPWHKDDD